MRRIMGDKWFKNRQELGKRGEEVALEYLLQRGMKLLERNWRCGHKELDLVMEEEGFIRIVEVRTREYPSIVEPFESITVQKRSRVIAAAKGYMAQKGKFLQGGKEVVFDIVSVLFNGELFEVKYMREAFAPKW